MKGTYIILKKVGPKRWLYTLNGEDSKCNSTVTIKEGVQKLPSKFDSIIVEGSFLPRKLYVKYLDEAGYWAIPQ